MNSSLDVLSALYQVVNIPSVTDTITGAVYIGEAPHAKKNKQNIELNVLDNKNRYLQNGYCNVNISLIETQSGRPDLGKFKEVVNVLKDLLQDAQHDNYWFQIEDDKGVFKDQDRDSVYLYNFKLTFQTL